MIESAGIEEYIVQGLKSGIIWRESKSRIGVREAKQSQSSRGVELMGIAEDREEKLGRGEKLSKKLGRIEIKIINQ